MLDETLWDAFVASLPDNVTVSHAALSGGTTVAEIARHIAERAPERFVLIGFSLGGYVARQLAADYPQKVHALVIIASSLRADTNQQAQSKQQAINMLTPTTFKGLGAGAVAKSLHPRRVSDVQLIARIQDMGNRLGYAAFVLQSELSRTGIRTESIACPTLVVAGGHDALRSIDEARELTGAIPGASLQVFEGSGHMIPLEQPKELADAIIHWLDTVGLPLHGDPDRD